MLSSVLRTASFHSLWYLCPMLSSADFLTVKPKFVLFYIRNYIWILKMLYLWLRIYILIHENISKIFQNSIVVSLRILTLCSLLLLLSSLLLNIRNGLFRMFYLALHILHVRPIQHSFLIFGNRFLDKLLNFYNNGDRVNFFFFPAASYFYFGRCPVFFSPFIQTVF